MGRDVAQPLFVESQRFRVTRQRILLAIPPFFLLLLVVWQVILGHPIGKQPMSNASIIGWTIFLWLVYFRLITVRLVTRVGPSEITVAMRGFWRERRIPLAEITSVETVTFDPVRDWGGYGMRTTSRGSAYIACGGRGVEIKLAKGGVAVIGSERADELAAAIRRLTTRPKS